MTNTVEWFVGGLLVVVYAFGRFRTPKSNCGSTTAFRFHLAALCYYASALIVFYSLALLLHSSPQALEAFTLGGTGNGLSETLKRVASPVLAALLLTALLPNFPILSKMDQWFLRLFQDIGNIPFEVRTWRDRLSRVDPVVEPAARRALLKRLAGDPRFAAIPASALRFEPDDSLSYELTKVIYLMTTVEDFGVSRGKYPRILEEFAEEYAALKVRFDQLLGSTVRSLPAIEKTGDPGVTPVPVLELTRSVRERCEELIRDLCQLLARGILTSELSQQGRQAKLASLGFKDVEERSPRLDVNHILTLATVICLVCFTGVMLFAQGYGANTQGALFLSVKLAVIYGGCAVVCALAPKGAWRIADIEALGARPVLGYALSGLLGTACAAIVSLLFKSLQFGSLVAAASDMKQNSYPWLLTTFVATVSLAYLADDWGGRADRAARWGRWVEGLAEAALLAGASVVVWKWLMDLPGRTKPVPPFESVVTIGAALGLFLGAFVPSWYRRPRSLVERHATPAQPLLGDVSALVRPARSSPTVVSLADAPPLSCEGTVLAVAPDHMSSKEHRS